MSPPTAAWYSYILERGRPEFTYRLCQILFYDEENDMPKLAGQLWNCRIHRK